MLKGMTSQSQPAMIGQVIRVLNEDSEVPLYVQLADLLEGGIRRGDFRERRRMPSRSELIETYGVSGDTGDRAMRLLDARGLVNRVKGRGVFAKPVDELPPRRDSR